MKKQTFFYLLLVNIVCWVAIGPTFNKVSALKSETSYARGYVEGSNDHKEIDSLRMDLYHYTDSLKLELYSSLYRLVYLQGHIDCINYLGQSPNVDSLITIHRAKAEQDLQIGGDRFRRVTKIEQRSRYVSTSMGQAK